MTTTTRKTETLYRKVGRRYVAVAEYSSDRCGTTLANGAYLVSVGDGCTSYRRVEGFDADTEVGALVAQFTKREIAEIASKAVFDLIESKRAAGDDRISINDEGEAVAEALMMADERLLARL